MSELIDNAKARQAVLKHLILQLHEGKAPQEVKPQLLRLLGRVPYHEVVAVEQELIKDGVPVEDILRLCDLHSAAMKGALDSSGPPELPPGHPVDTFRKENQALIGELELADRLFAEIEALPEEADAEEPLGHLRVRFSRLADVGKHYSRKENLVFPYLEQKGITGPPTVMWGKDDEVRAAVKGALEALAYSGRVSVGDAKGVIDLVLRPAVEAIREMIFKEEEILFPMCLEKLTDAEWYAIARQSPAIGFCIYDPVEDWQPEGPAAETETASPAAPDRLQFPSGSLSPVEIQTILNTIPFDLTFVGADDTVRYFTQGRERIFERNRAIIGRKVQMCHPPGSVHIVQRIIDDFKAGRADRAPFWIELHGKFIHIEYFAVRDEHGTYLGTLEVSQDLTGKRALTGQKRLLSYE
ncbi:MAG TPA: DUF438 domain-containing protein [candidate division Zixibacteria bacterium]|nr:DUF438 domain-containing protein [candidate division Zixibacteria bacterium]MDD4917671.1 DUF438 domain-containing protein [candidate division Zixibacteria bacterium]MDM7974075.1 DUF438 domain-containing protein [candidate division Zixibacteria bacterium]HOD65562.1 DUF438 domain-containing protein [candidate division Zixibacteria bacterium]HOZ06672.1 DUF438 domain-containing protein [candidate division Zixibacteria bacterium]